MPIFRPQWFEELDITEPSDRLIRNKFLIRQAALVHNPEGSLEILANAVGVHYHSLVRLYYERTERRRGGGIISAEMAVKIEQAVGKEAIPRKLLRPDLFE